MLGIDNSYSKYDFFTFNESNYGSREEYLSWRNYIQQKREMSDDLLSDLATSMIASGFNAVKHIIKNDSKKQIEKLADDVMKQIVKENPNMTWNG